MAEEKTQKETATPQATTKPPEGKIEMGEKSGYLAELVAYHVLRSLADAIASQVETATDLKAQKPCRILITTDANDALDTIDGLQADAQLTALQDLLPKQEKAVVDAHTALAKPAATAKAIAFAVPTAAALLGAVQMGVSAVGQAADLAGYLLRGSYAIRGVAFTLSSEALAHAVAGFLEPRGVTPYLPALLPVNAAPVLERFEAVVTHQITLEARTNALKELIQSVTAAGGTPPPALPAAKRAIDEAQGLLTVAAKLLQGMVTQAEGKPHSPLAAAALRERYDVVGVTHTLYVKVLSGGGEAISRQKAFEAGHVSYVGGCVASFVLADRQGEILLAQTLVDYSQLSCNLDKPEDTQLYARLLSSIQ